MSFLSLLIYIQAKVLLYQNILSVSFARILSIVFIYAGVLSSQAFFVQTIGLGIGIYSGLFELIYYILCSITQVLIGPIIQIIVKFYFQIKNFLLNLKLFVCTVFYLLFLGVLTLLKEFHIYLSDYFKNIYFKTNSKFILVIFFPFITDLPYLYIFYYYYSIYILTFSIVSLISLSCSMWEDFIFQIVINSKYRGFIFYSNIIYYPRVQANGLIVYDNGGSPDLLVRYTVPKWVPQIDPLGHVAGIIAPPNFFLETLTGHQIIMKCNNHLLGPGPTYFDYSMRVEDYKFLYGASLLSPIGSGLAYLKNEVFIFHKFLSVYFINESYKVEVSDKFVTKLLNFLDSPQNLTSTNPRLSLPSLETKRYLALLVKDLTKTSFEALKDSNEIAEFAIEADDALSMADKSQLKANLLLKFT